MKSCIAIIFCILFLACNNNGEGEVRKDTLIEDPVYHVPSNKGDTSSYDRMSNRVVDSVNQ